MQELSSRLNQHRWQLLTRRKGNNPELVFEAVLVPSEASGLNLEVDPSKIDPYRAFRFFGYLSRELEALNDIARNVDAARHVQRIKSGRHLPNAQISRGGHYAGPRGD
jgi:hypothetical protein